ncbi:hypothetical protein ACSMEV_13185 [Pseudomonas sp. MLB6B]
MDFLSTYLPILAPIAMVLGLYGLIRCIGRARRLIFPELSVRFPASAQPLTVAIPTPGRYVINVVIPPMTFLTGVAHFSAKFRVVALQSGASLEYRSYGRSLLHLFEVDRTDMSGKKSMPLGAFDCAAPGEVAITCLNPDSIRANYALEVSPYVSPLSLFAVVLPTIASAAMTIGGFVLSILAWSGNL